MRHLADLDKDGFFVLRNEDLIRDGAEDVPIPLSSDRWSLHEHTNETTRIFQRFLEGFRSDSGDGLRHQFDPSECEPLSHVADYVERVGVSFFPDLIPSTRKAVVSLPGCKTQQAHMDAHVAIPALSSCVNIGGGLSKIDAWAQNRPVSVLYCVDDHAYVHVWPGSHHDSFKIVKSWWRTRLHVTDAASYDEEIESQRIKGNNMSTPSDKKMTSTLLRLNKGDMVFFYQDLVHAGAGYVSLNCRLHQFFDNATVSRADDETGNLRRMFHEQMHPSRYAFSSQES
jgi:hypothetical protein